MIMSTNFISHQLLARLLYKYSWSQQMISNDLDALLTFCIVSQTGLTSHQVENVP